MARFEGMFHLQRRLGEVWGLATPRARSQVSGKELGPSVFRYVQCIYKVSDV